MLRGRSNVTGHLGGVSSHEIEEQRVRDILREIDCCVVFFFCAESRAVHHGSNQEFFHTCAGDKVVKVCHPSWCVLVSMTWAKDAKGVEDVGLGP